MSVEPVYPTRPESLGTVTVSGLDFTQALARIRELETLTEQLTTRLTKAQARNDELIGQIADLETRPATTEAWIARINARLDAIDQRRRTDQTESHAAVEDLRGRTFQLECKLAAMHSANNALQHQLRWNEANRGNAERAANRDLIARIAKLIEMEEELE